ncbi:MAG: alpha/beta hydrolase [Rhodospirillaceae bacterium]|nr:alpha/beta hydrolase [Rhodospirillaceae bacterium]
MGANAQSKESQKVYVLVHGAWHGGWCWRDVAASLRAAGHVVFTPTLTGLGERAHLVNKSVNLSTHVTDIEQLFSFEDLSDVILVGHSYAGHVVPLVADRLKSKIRHVVFLDAVLPRDGHPFLAPGVGEGRAKTAIDGYLLAPMDVAWFGVPADHPKADWVRRHLTNHPLPTLMETVRYANGGTAGLPVSYIRCLKRRDVDQPDAIEAQVKANDGWRWLTIDTGHDAMVTAPDDLSRMLLTIA